MGCGSFVDLLEVDSCSSLHATMPLRIRLGIFLGFAHAEAYLAHAVSHDHKYAEAEPLSALTTLLTLLMGYMPQKAQAPAAIGFIVRCLLRHVSLPPPRTSGRLARRFCQGLDSAVIDMSAAVKNDSTDTWPEHVQRSACRLLLQLPGFPVLSSSRERLLHR